MFSRTKLSLFLLLLFILEGSVVQVFVPSAWGMSYETIPRFALVGTILISLFIGRREGLIYGLIFGLLQDVVFGHIIGVYTLSMMVASYLAGLVLMLFHRSIAVVFTTLLLVLFGHEWLTYTLFRLFVTNPVDVQWTLTHEIFPTVLLNMVFAAFVYVLMKKLCLQVQENKERSHE